MREMRKISILRDMGLDDLEQIASSALQHDPSLRTTCSILLDDTPTSLEKLSQSVQSYATSVNDESVDDLLRWSGTLDYDKYSDDWLATGVTITQREMNNSSSLESSKLSVLGIPGHRPGAPCATQPVFSIPLSNEFRRDKGQSHSRHTRKFTSESVLELVEKAQEHLRHLP